jgi:hypothetical protein
MTATIITFAAPAQQSVKEPSSVSAEIAGFIFPAVNLRRDGLLSERYYLPRGMGPRQHDRVWRRLLRSPEGRTFCQLMDRVFDAKLELEAAVTEQHRMLFSAMQQHFPDMARRIMRKMKRRDLMTAATARKRA